MEKSPFRNKPVDGVRKGIPKNEFKDTTALQNQFLPKLLGVGLACMLAFFLYNVYTELIPENQSAKDKLSQNTNDYSGGIVSLEPEIKYIGTEILNGKVGEEITIKSTRIAPYTDAYFEIIMPSGEKKDYQENSKVLGYAEVNVPENTFTQVGEYQVIVKAEGYESRGVQKFFLRESDMSAEKSNLTTEKNITPINQPVIITVELLDEFGNPIKDKVVSIITTRPNSDTISFIDNDRTGVDGKIQFRIISKEPGKSSFLALNPESGITLNKKIDITFELPVTDSDGLVSTILGYLIHKAEAASDVSYYVIDSPDEFYQAEPTPIVVKVYDNSNNLITDYLGQVKFSASDELAAVLPEDYTFTENDEGTHEFQVTFNTLGVFYLTVSATGDASIKGEKQVNVVAPENTDIIMKPLILSPPKGLNGQETTINNPKIDIAGKAEPNTTIEIYDNDIYLGEVLSNASGLFFFKTDTLVDGRHSFKAVSINSNGASNESDVVSIIIDTTNPILLKQTVSLSPNSLMPGDSTTITVVTEPQLISVKAIINKTAITLEEDPTQAGIYTGNYVAPNQTGTYNVDIELQDNVTNPVTFKNQASLVVALVPQIQLPTPENPSPPEKINQTPPDTGPAEIILMSFVIAMFFGWTTIKN
jgi:hypothetical protein